jgi:hypothetical protein
LWKLGTSINLYILENYFYTFKKYRFRAVFQFGMDSVIIMDKSERSVEFVVIPASVTQDVNWAIFSIACDTAD